MACSIEEVFAPLNSSMFSAIAEKCGDNLFGNGEFEERCQRGGGSG